MHKQLDIPLFAVSSKSMAEFSKKKKRERKKISVKQDAINFFTPQLILSVFRVSLANGKMDSHLAYFIIQLKFHCCNFSKPINKC